jgi:hypothetical protein
VVDRLRATGTLMTDIQRKASEVKAGDIVSPGDVAYAEALKQRLTAANDVLEKRWAPIQRDLTQLGLNYKESWIAITEILATGVGYLNQMYAYAKAIPDFFARLGNSEVFKRFAASLPTPEGATEMTPEVIARMKAERQLAAGLSSPSAVQQGTRAASELYNSILGDTSKLQKEAKENTKNLAGEFDRLERSVLRAAAAHEADAQTVGQSVGEIEKARVAARLLEAAQQAGIEVLKGGAVVNQDYYDRIQTAAARAGKSVQDLAQARLEAQVKFQTQTMFLSPEDLKVAQAMNQIWGSEWSKHTDDNLARQIKFNDVLAQTRDMFSGAATGFVKDLLEGKDVMEAMPSAAAGLGSKMVAAKDAKDKASDSEEKQADAPRRAA